MVKGSFSRVALIWGKAKPRKGVKLPFHAGEVAYVVTTAKRQRMTALIETVPISVDALRKIAARQGLVPTIGATLVIKAAALAILYLAFFVPSGAPPSSGQIATAVMGLSPR